MLYIAVQFIVVPYISLQCCAVQFSDLHCSVLNYCSYSTMQYIAIKCSALLWSKVPRPCDLADQLTIDRVPLSPLPIEPECTVACSVWTRLRCLNRWRQRTAVDLSTLHLSKIYITVYTALSCVIFHCFVSKYIMISNILTELYYTPTCWSSVTNDK